MSRTLILLLGILATLAATALWHGPLGTGERLVGNLDARARAELQRWDMGAVRARAGRGPLSRDLALSGPADDFQRSELARIMSDVPGVGRAYWAGGRAPGSLPLIVEAMLASLAGFFLGWLLAYLWELRRRARRNREW